MMVTKDTVREWCINLDEDAIRACRWLAYFNLSLVHPERLSPLLLDQLENCKDDSARRLLLGISR